MLYIALEGIILKRVMDSLQCGCYSESTQMQKVTFAYRREVELAWVFPLGLMGNADLQTQGTQSGVVQLNGVGVRPGQGFR